VNTSSGKFNFKFSFKINEKKRQLVLGIFHGKDNSTEGKLHVVGRKKTEKDQ